MSWKRVAAVLAVVLPALVCRGQGTAFTYQGRLTDGGSPADGLYDLTFSLYDAEVGGLRVAGPVLLQNTPVEDGLFSATIDFGGEDFALSAVWLEIEVGGVTLSPRTMVTGSPLALQTRGMFVDIDGEFTGVGRSEPISSFERFGIQTHGGANQYGGMYIGTDSDTGRPFYGYATGNDNRMWHYYDGPTRNWILYNGGIRMTVTSLGFVGIGDDTPSNPLEVASSTSTNTIVARNTNPNANATISGAQFDGTDSTGVLGLTTEGTRGQGVWGASYNSQGVGVRGTASAGVGVIYGVLGEAYSSSGYDFYAAGTGVNYGAASSRRWKSDIRPIADPLKKLGRLRGVTFDWDAAHGGQRDIGMIAEEVGEVLPEIVVYEENGVDANGMDYAKLTPLLVEAVNELQTRNDREIGELRAQNEELRARVASLEAMVAGMLSKGERE